MIELIFVIVIIGILASVAIPKLAATRDDAIDARDCKNLAVCITDLAAMYTATGEVDKTKSLACKGVENSNKNDINVTVDMVNQQLVIKGAPKRCNHLNEIFQIGGSRVKN
jgi:type II secretory pathway pseudopilin PulG